MLVSSCIQTDTSLPDEINRRAYLLRYVNVDSSLFYAQRAYDISHDYDYIDGKAEAISHKAFVLYQQMLFSRAIEQLDRIDSLTHNQVELLCADVLRMKISQRTGEVRTFYRSWHNAETRLRRIDEELHLLSPHYQKRVLYARTEMHIIASTQYFYSQQDSASRAEMQAVEPYMQTPLDTAQWCNYMYMLGAGGIITGDSVSVILKEFDQLTHVLTIARRRNDKYFQANSLQALALIMENPYKVELIKKQRGGGMDFIVGQYANQNPHLTSDSLSLVLANQALRLFKEYGDKFQTANVLRTISELLFRQGRYQEALMPIYEALMTVEEQHSKDAKRVFYWEASFYERMSLIYSAMGNKQLAMECRSAYFSMLENIRQDLEEEVRREELRSYNKRLYLHLTVTVVLLLGVAYGFGLLLSRAKKLSKKQEREAEETLQLTIDETKARELQLLREKLSNVERRAKVGLAENVVPYINRMLHTKDKEYVAELSAEILRINGILTDWIQVKQGKVAMNISTFALQPLLNTISKNRTTYHQKGLTLEVMSADNICVKGDKALTLFMINTLCDNARKFTPSGGKVSISVIADDNVVEISVSDTGCGISSDNVEKINNSKVFRIVTDQDKKQPEAQGFGFGLMNCKGIIGQMQKLSTRFHCCDFGVESQLGEGSRFWFKLPRVLSVIFFFLCFTASQARTDYTEAQSQYELLKQSNTTNNFIQAMKYGKKALELVPNDSLLLRMKIENEMAIAAQSLCLWQDYRQHHNQCVRLYREYTADPNLPIYARRLHIVKTEITWTQFFILFFLIFSLFFFVLVVRRSRRRRSEMYHQQDLQMMQTEMLNRVQYELDRVHIQNRILDNCLSTIKHETMYYPARIQQMAMYQDADMGELQQLINYYNEIYTILLEQAQRQTSIRLAIDESVLVELKRRVRASVGNVPIDVRVADQDNIIEVRVSVKEYQIPENLFTFEAGNLDAFVAREIVRMYDAACGYPGLRLYVENNEIIITLWKNSRLLSSKTFNWN